MTNKQQLELLANLPDSEIMVRSIITGVLFVLLLIVIDLFVREPIDIANRIMLGFIFTGVFALYDFITRAIARRQLK